MKSSAECRAIGAELSKLSDVEKDALRQNAYRRMAACWRALAEQYERQAQSTRLMTSPALRKY